MFRHWKHGIGIRLLPIVFFVCLTACPLGAEETALDRGQLFLSYQLSGGHYGAMEVSVGIWLSGDAEVKGSQPDRLNYSYETNLSEEELEALKTLIRSTQFFSQQDQSESLITHAGETVLSIKDGDEMKTLRYKYLPELAPLQQFIWKLVTQAKAISAIESDGDFYTASGAVNPRLVGAKALQPNRFVQPLTKYVKEGTLRAFTPTLILNTNMQEWFRSFGRSFLENFLRSSKPIRQSVCVKKPWMRWRKSKVRSISDP